MKYLLLLACWGLSLGAWAQSVSHRPDNSQDKLQRHKELASESLDEGQRLAYTRRAKQKVGELVDCLNLIAQSQDAGEQQKALARLQRLFERVPAWASSAEGVRKQAGKQTITLQSVQVEQELAYRDDETYSGVLAYQWTGRQGRWGFVVQKKWKRVGSQKIKTWEVFLVE